MPPVEIGNVQVSRQESFTLSTSTRITWDDQNAAQASAISRLSLPTDQDGDFWCNQIYVTAFDFSGVVNANVTPPTMLMQITDARTGRQLGYPTGVPLYFLQDFTDFQDKSAAAYSDSPLPSGFRSTSTLIQPFCFTRQGAVQLELTALGTGAGGLGSGVDLTVDISFGGWKEYAYASA